MGRKLILGVVTLVFFFYGGAGLMAQVLENYDPQLERLPSGGWFWKGDVISTQADISSFPLSDLQIKIPSGGSLFFDGKLWCQASSDTVFFLPLATIKSLVGDDRHQIDVVVYGKGIDKPDISIRKVNKLALLDPQALEASVISDAPMARDKDVFREFFFIALMVFLLLTAVFKLIHPIVFSVFLNPLPIFSSEDFSEGASFNKFFSNALLYYLLLINMVVMLVFMTGINYLDQEPFGLSLSNSLNNLFFVWILGALLLTTVSFFKFIWLKVAGFIFGISKFEFLQFLFILRILTFGLIVIIAGLGIGLANESQLVENLIDVFGNGFFGLYVLAMILLWTLMRKRLSFKNYHLFSYICTSELIPFLVITKLLIG